MQGYRIGQKVSEKLTPIIVNEYGDEIYIDINDTTFVDKVINLFQWFEEKNREIGELINKKKDEFDNIDVTDKDKINSYKTYISIFNEMYKEICEQFDKVFGEGTIRKYFRKLYEVYGDDFVPDDECITDFIEEIMPVLDQLFAMRKEKNKKRHSKKKKV